MLIKRTSILSGETREIDLPVTQAQLDEWYKGKLAQIVFSNLTPSQREFIMTGITDQEWDVAFGERD